MNVTRPTSSKGRSRAAVGSPPYGGDADGVQRPPESGCGRPDRSLRSQSQPIMREAGGRQEAPPAPLQPFNKYKVLPSIERRRAEASPPGGRRSLDQQMAELHLSDAAAPLRPDLPSSAAGPKADTRADDGPRLPDPGPERTSLLLAIRAPCGRRFQQRFEPTDALRAVRASAEARYGTRYGDVSIETMDVPRRTFTDLDVTLAQSGILNRSVLFISQKDSAVEQESL